MSREPFETMPDVMDVKQIAAALQISRAGAYSLLNDPTFQLYGSVDANW